jgi:hypothetical protein
MKKNNTAHIFLAETVLHILFSVAVIEAFFTEEKKIIIWFGDANIKERYPWLFEDKEIEFIVVNNPSNLSFFKLDISVKEIQEKIEYLASYDCSITTYYDTAYGFEIIRDYLNIPWEKVSLLEDGQANYLRNVAMPSQSRRVAKHLVNKIMGRFGLNMSLYNLGGNLKIRTFFSMSPEHVYILSPAQSKVHSIASNVKNILKRSTIELIGDSLQDVDGVITLTPIYAYKRKTKRELLIFLDQTVTKYSIQRPLIKPHPRDYSLGITTDILEYFGNTVELSPEVPTEFLFEHLGPCKWYGPPSSAMLNRHFIYPDVRDEFYISEFGTSSQFAKKQVQVFRDIMGDKAIEFKAVI